MANVDFELYDLYLNDELSEKKRYEFELKLKSNSDFQKDFEAYKEVHAYLDNSIGNSVNREAFIENVKLESDVFFNDKKVKNIQPKQRKIKPIFYAIAASVILLFGLLFTRNTTPLYNDYANYGNIELTVRSSNNSTIEKAEAAYNSQNFTEALKYIDELLNNFPSNNELLLYKAISLLELEKYDEADVILNKLKQGYSVFKNKALWWAALSKLKQNKIPMCKKILLAVPKDAEDFELAQKLLKKLK